MFEYLHSVATHITPVEVGVAVIIGTIVSAARWAERQALRVGIRAFKNERQRRTHSHVHNGHKGHPNKCQHDDCADIIAATDSVT